VEGFPLHSFYITKGDIERLDDLACVFGLLALD
jgi:hypothetical protein